MIYLDNSATTPVMKESADLVYESMTHDFYNPSALYAPAVSQERRVTSARSVIAHMLGAQSNEVFFTSGGTESNNMAILGCKRPPNKQRCRYICSCMEHSAVFQVMKYLESQGHEWVVLPVDEKGLIHASALEQSIDENTMLVSVMHVNNEVGSIQDLDTLYHIVKQKNPHTVFHSDGVQAFGKMDTASVLTDVYSISGHKFYAPKGVGALMIRQKVKHAGGQLGGGQENNMRSGTLNVPSILGMAKSAKIVAEHHYYQADMLTCKTALAHDLLSIPDVFVNGPDIDQGAAHILNMSFCGVRAEVLLHALEEKNIYVSTGSACSSKNKENRILTAMGLPPQRAQSAIRFSFSYLNTTDQMHEVAQIIGDLVIKLRRFQPR